MSKSGFWKKWSLLPFAVVGQYNRPVSILCVVSKILEKALYIQLEQFLVTNNLLYERQSGFRGSHCTDSCLIHLFDHIKPQSSRGSFTGMVMLDLQKAFDTVNHDILCDKLKLMGLEPVEWFRSYLSDRNQVVNINNVTSSPLNITCRGVANGGAGGADCPPGHQKSGRRAKIGKGEKGERKEKRGKGREKRKGKEEEREREKEREKGKKKRKRKGKEKRREERGKDLYETLINIMFHRYLNISNGMNFA